MHPKETRNRVGTGRMAHLILKNSLLIEGISFDENPKVQKILNDPEILSLILYPGSKALNLDDVGTLMKAGNRDYRENEGKELWLQLERIQKHPSHKIVLFVIDATWPLAKKMMRLSSCLHYLPQVCFTNPGPSAYKFRLQPHPLCLSTIESLYQVIRALKQASVLKPDENQYGAENNLLATFDWMVNKQLDLKSDPSTPGYRRQSYTKEFLKGQSKSTLNKKNRPIFFNL
jgi:DTW domain-containing protein YfiP